MSDEIQQTKQNLHVWAKAISEKESYLPKLHNAIKGIVKTDADAQQYVKRLIYVAGKTVQNSPTLLKIARADGGASLADSLTFIAMRGLPIDPVFGQAWLIPYGSKITPQVGSRGWLAFAQRQFKITNLIKVPLYQFDVDNNTFQWEVKDNVQHVSHNIAKTMLLPKDKRGKIGAAYVILQVQGVGTIVKLGMVEDLMEDARRAKGQSANMKFWIDFPAQMAIKTLVRKACQDLPLDGTFMSEWILDHNVIESTCVDVPSQGNEVDMLDMDADVLIPEEYLPHEGAADEIVLPD